MPTNTEITEMKVRKNAAWSAIKFFKDKKSVKSTNNPFAFTTAADQATLNHYRTNNPDTIVQSFHDAARTGIGNCDEKGRMCYAALRSNPLLANSHVTLCEAINYDHVFVVVANIAVGGATTLDQLGVTAMVVDGWTEDWYFPNLGLFDAKWHNLGNTPNPRQFYVRLQVANHRFQGYGGVYGMPADM